jgi:O-antigen/teichoic acid export membrane protein
LRRFFAKNLLFIIALNALVKPVWIFAIDRTVQNKVGHASYGTYQALINLGVIMQFVLDFGLNYYNTQMISRKPESYAVRFPAMLGLRLLLMGLYAAVVLGIGWMAGYRGDVLGLLCGTLLIQTLTILLLFIRSNVAAFQRFRLDGILSVADRMLMILLCGILLLLPVTRHQFTIGWFVWAQVACYSAAICLGFYMLWRITGVPLRLSFHFRHVGAMLRASAPYALLIFFMSIYMRADIPLIERLHSAQEAGRYIGASRQLDVCNQFAILFAGILLPLFGRMQAEGQSLAPIVRLSVNLLLPLSLLASIIAWTAGTGIMHLLYPVANAYDGRLFAWVMSCLPAYSLMYIFSTLLTANGALTLLNIQAGAAAVLNVVLNCIVVPKYGAEGAAIVACITQWSIALSTLFFATRRNALQLYPKWAGSHLAYLILLGLAGFAANVLFHGAWVYVTATLLAAAALLIFVFRFITLAALRQFLSRRQAGHHQ